MPFDPCYLLPCRLIWLSWTLCLNSLHDRHHTVSTLLSRPGSCLASCSSIILGNIGRLRMHGPLTGQEGWLTCRWSLFGRRCGGELGRRSPCGFLRCQYCLLFKQNHNPSRWALIQLTFQATTNASSHYWAYFYHNSTIYQLPSRHRTMQHWVLPPFQ